MSLGGLAARPWQKLLILPEFTQSERLGRVTAGKIEIKARADADAKRLAYSMRTQLLFGCGKWWGKTSTARTNVG